MASDDTAKPEEVAPEEPKAPETPPTAAAEPAAPPPPPADPVKQVSDAAHQASASIDQSLSTMSAQNRVVLVAVASILVGGWLGSIINGQVMKGIAIFVAAGVLLFLGPFTLGLSILLLLLLHIVLIVDAILIASRKGKGETFGDWDFFCWKPAPKAS